jgi:ribonuclease BN (tRNA processing enzyme)
MLQFFYVLIVGREDFMDIRIQMLGTGSAFSKKYHNNNALVSCNGFRLLFDCGATANRSLAELGIGLDTIDGVFISHLHADHIGGLEEFAFRMFYEYKKRPVLYLPQPLRKPLWNHSLKGGLSDEKSGLTALDSYFDVREVQEGVPFLLKDGFVIETVQTKHIPAKYSCGVIFNDRIFYSSDTIFDRNLLNYIDVERRCEVIMHDCQFTSPGAVHASLQELLTLPDDIQRKVLLMHYGDNMESYIGRTGSMTFMEQHKIYTFE